MKKKLAVAFGLLSLLGLLIIDNYMVDKAIAQCVEGGNSYDFCERGLR